MNNDRDSVTEEELISDINQLKAILDKMCLGFHGMNEEILKTSHRLDQLISEYMHKKV
jgi:hypothetical protein